MEYVSRRQKLQAELDAWLAKNGNHVVINQENLDKLQAQLRLKYFAGELVSLVVKDYITAGRIEIQKEEASP